MVETMNKGTAAFLVSEANGHRSRETATVTVAAADVTAFPNGIPAGLVLGQVTASGKYARVDSGAADGTETAAAVLYEPIANPAAGDYTRVAIVRDAEVAASKCTFSAPANETAETADLATVGIIAR